jgi:hypothetical protein
VLRSIAVPARKIPGLGSGSARHSARTRSRAQIERIMLQRERLVADIAQLRERGATSRFINNAQQLLTRWWSTATWTAREELLKSAEWLVRLEKGRGYDATQST